MIRTLLFAVKMAVLVAVAIWLAGHPGVIDIHWQGYDVRVDFAFAAALAFVSVVLLLLLQRLWLVLLSLPEKLQHYSAQRAQQNGYRSLTLGLTAVAAGDAKAAAHHASRARTLLADDKGLPVLLEGQAARLKGDDKAARECFETLLGNKDTAFLGLRGLLLSSLEHPDMGRAADLTSKALKMYPRQPFVLRMVYEMELRQQHWAEAEKLLQRLSQVKAFDAEKIKSDRMALLLQLAEEAQGEAVYTLLRKAYAVNTAFVPAALRLARHYLDNGKARQAVRVIERTWKESPHPELVALWKECAPPGKAQNGLARMRWFERLVKLAPQSMDAQMAAAAAAMDEQMWGVAREYLEAAANLGASVRLFHLRAKLAQAQGRHDEMALMLRRAADAPPDRQWICRETGNVYPHWSPVARPHGSFNSIVWDYPRPLLHADRVAEDRTELLIAAPSRY